MRVTLENITKEFYSKNKSVKAVDNLNITIESGKLIGFLGPSGCGKSTSLYMIAGIHTLTSGRILFDDQDVSGFAPEKRGVGMVFQNYALYPHLTIRENIAFPLVNSKGIKNKLKQKLSELNESSGTKLTFKELVAQQVEEAARLVEITQYLDRKPGELSGGQQQRVAIARAIVKEPTLLLLDEPLSNLDARLRLQTRDEIKRIQQKTGITTIFVTHDQEEALTICDEIVIMKDGVFQQQGNPQAVYDTPVNQFVAKFLGTPPINLINGEIKNGTLCLSGAPWKETPSKVGDQKVTVGIRAENLRIVDENEQESFSATVLSIERLGGATTMDVQLADGGILRMYLDISRPSAVGDKLRLAVLKGNTLIFSGDGGKLLQC